MFLYIKYIIQGWWNVILDLFSDLKYKKYFDERMSICRQCPYNKYNVCTVCHCPLISKTKSEDSMCPLKKWLSIKETIRTNK